MEATNLSQLLTNITDIAIRAKARRARRLMLQGDLGSATAVYREILTLAPANANAHYQPGICLRHTRRWKEAVAALQRASELGDSRAASLMAKVRATLPGTEICNETYGPIEGTSLPSSWETR